jgi:hypothetical protein
VNKLDCFESDDNLGGCESVRELESAAVGFDLHAQAQAATKELSSRLTVSPHLRLITMIIRVKTHNAIPLKHAS